MPLSYNNSERTKLFLNNSSNSKCDIVLWMFIKTKLILSMTTFGVRQDHKILEFWKNWITKQMKKSTTQDKSLKIVRPIEKRQPPMKYNVYDKSSIVACNNNNRTHPQLAIKNYKKEGA